MIYHLIKIFYLLNRNYHKEIAWGSKLWMVAIFFNKITHEKYFYHEKQKE
jgi:hypothetical protein